MMVFSKDSLWTKLSRLIKEEKPLVLVAYDKSIFIVKDCKKRYKRKKRNHLYNQKKKVKELLYLNLLYSLKNCISQSFCLITKFFNIKIGFLIEIKIYIITVLRYLSTVKIITGMKTK